MTRPRLVDPPLALFAQQFARVAEPARRAIHKPVARRRVATFMGGVKGTVENPGRWLYITLGLGLLFVVGQYVAWLQLSAQGVFLATNPSSSFFYVLTAAHALHVVGGLSGMFYVIRQLHKSVLRRSSLVAVSRYWHFMGGLWVYLLLLLWLKV